MTKLALIGHPVSHSLSPLIHNYWIKKYGLGAIYEAIDVVPDDFETCVRALIDDGYHGFNFTIPHKIIALDFCDSVQDVASDMRAINTLFRFQGQLCGTNTDAFGFIENLKAEAPQFDIRKSSAVVLGAGGAARGVVHGLLKAGAKGVIILNRTRAKAEALAEKNEGVKVIGWDERASALLEADLLVNTTSLGMASEPSLALDLSALRNDTVVYDIIYAPFKTALLAEAEARGNTAINGLGMLVHQARKSFEAWFGILPDYDDGLREMLMAELGVS